MENIATRPNDLIPVSDDYLLAEKNDIIDNSVFAFITEVINGTNPRVDFDIAAEAYCCDPEQYKALDEKAKDALYHKTVSYTTDTIERFGIDTADFDWNMTVIAEAGGVIECGLVDLGVAVCHPWHDEDELICHSTDERCAHCPYCSCK